MQLFIMQLFFLYGLFSFCLFHRLCFFILSNIDLVCQFIGTYVGEGRMEVLEMALGLLLFLIGIFFQEIILMSQCAIA